MNLIQRISSILNIGNTFNQKINCYENEEIVEEYFRDKFKEFDKYLNDDDIDSLENSINNLEDKKENYPENVEKKILKYRAYIYLKKDDTQELDRIIKKLEKIKNSKKELQEIKLNIAIVQDNEELFIKLKDEWIKDKKSSDLVKENEIKFLFFTGKYSDTIDEFDYEKYKDNSEILDMLGESLTEEKRYEESEHILSLIKNNSDKYNLAYIVNKVKKYFDGVSYISDVKNIDMLKEYINELDSINKNNLYKPQQELVNLIYLQLYYFVDSKEAEELLNKLRINNENDFCLNSVGIDILEKNNKLEKAKELALLAVESNINELILNKLLRVLYRLGKWEELKDIYSANKSNIDDKYGFCMYFYGLSLKNLYGEECTLKILEKELDHENIMHLLLLAHLNEKNLDICNEYLGKICMKVDEDDLILIDVCNIYLQLNDYQRAYKCVLTGSKKNKEFFKKLIEVTLKGKMKCNYYTLIDIHIKNYSEEINSYIDTNMYYISIESNNYRYAYYIAEKLYEDMGNEQWTNEYIRMKLINDDYDNLDIMVKEIEHINKSEYIVTAAEVYCYLEEYQRADTLCYKAFYFLNESNNQEDILIRINRISLKIVDDVQYYEDNDKVSFDDVIILSHINDIIKICLNREKCYQTNEVRMDEINHIKTNNQMWIEIIGKQKGDIIKIGGDEYRINDIVNKKNYMYRKCFTAMIDDAEKSEFKGISINIDSSDEEPNFDEVKKVIKSSNERLQNLINMYIKPSEDIGIPIPIYCIRNEMESVKDIMESLMYSSTEGIVAGNPTMIEKGEKVVLSFLSAILLEDNNLLDDFLRYYDVYIGSRLIKELDDIIKKLISKFNKEDISLYLINNELIYDKKDEKYKKMRIEYYQNIIKKLNNSAHIIEKNIFSSELLRMSEIVVKSTDIESLEIAKDIKATLFIEDSFNVLLDKVIYSDIHISNTGGFISINLCENYEKYICFAEKFLKAKYRYVLNLKSILYLFIFRSIYNKKNRDKFKYFISLLLKNDIDKYYYSILKHICLITTFKSKQYVCYKEKIDIIMNAINENI